MTLLTDDDLHDIVGGPHPVVSGLDLTTDYHQARSQIRAAALDLRVGQIWLPGTDAGQDGSVDKPKTAHSLKSGETAIITLMEEFDLPSDIAGLVLPSPRVSITGLLMTNPGYIDPGYTGNLRFTVINMGERSYDLRHGNRIVTLMLFRLIKDCGASWRDRNPDTRYLAPSSEDLGKLSRDFLNVERRAREAADQKVKVAGLSPVILNGIVAAILVVGSFLVTQFTGIDQLKERITHIEANVDAASVKSQLIDHQKRLDKLDPPVKK